MTLQFERLTAPVAEVVRPDEIKEALRVGDDLYREAQIYVHAAANDMADHGGLAFTFQTIRAHGRGPFASGQVFALPIGPVQANAPITVTFLEFDGLETELAAGLYRLIPGKRPELRLLDVDLPAALADDRTRLLIDYEAGFGANSYSVPPDLRLAILGQAARDFDRLSDDFKRGNTSISASAARIISRYRGVRL